MEIYYEDPKRARLVGNIYKGIVKDVLSGISAGFIDVGEGENLFLSAKELNESLLRNDVTMAELVATGKVPELIAPFRLDRFRDDRAVSERASAGTH